MPDDDKNKHKEEVSVLLGLFKKLIWEIQEDGSKWRSLEELIKARADFAVRHAFNGFGISYDDAMELLKKADKLTDEERVQRDILVAAVDNLVDFSVAEEFHASEELEEHEEEIAELTELDEDSEDYEEIMAMLLAICTKNNDRYAYVENMDIEYAMIIAAYISSLRDDTTLTYMTMGDERVRPWHRQYEGYTAPRSLFPQWLIPPIEHQCRCFLVEDSQSSVFSQIQASKRKTSDKAPEMPEWFDRTFKECVAFGGRIFSDEHSYFQIKKKHIKRLKKISNKIKKSYFL